MPFRFGPGLAHEGRKMARVTLRFMDTKLRRSLSVLSHSQLLHRLEDLVCRDRRMTAEMLGVLAEVDQRKLWAAQAFPSMFEFCVKRFRMSEAVSGKRIWAARTARRFPVIFAMVARGELHLSAIHQLAKHLTDDNHRALLQRATHKTSREIELLVAEIAPKPDVPSRIRALPRRQGIPVPSSPLGPIGPVSPREASPWTVSDSTPPAAPIAMPATPEARKPSKPIVPLSPRRYKLEITVDQAVHDKLRMLEDLLSHQLPRADPTVIVSRALELLLAETLRKKAALTGRPRSRGASVGQSDEAAAHGRSDSADAKQDRAVSSPHDSRDVSRDGPSPTRSIPAAIRRQVWHRDGGRCAFVDQRGHRCGATRAVEYHHTNPFGKGGRHEPDNISLRCRAHNQYQADLDFGRKFMDGRRQGNMPRGMFEAGCSKRDVLSGIAQSAAG